MLKSIKLLGEEAVAALFNAEHVVEFADRHLHAHSR